jgi:ATP-dependent DNA helicase RecG
MIVRNQHDLQQALLFDSETEHVEFKEAKSDYDFDKLTDYCCALANEGGGSIILGVSDRMPRRIVGSAAFPNLDKAKKGLFDRLHIRVDTAVIKTADGRVLVFIVPARPPGLPVHVAGRYLMRVGSSLTAMSPQQLAVIFQESVSDYSAEPATGTTIAMLDTAAMAIFRKRWQKKSGTAEIGRWSDAKLLANAELTTDGVPTFAALILFGTDKSVGRHLAQAEAVFEYRSTEASLPYQQRVEFRRGFFSWMDELWALINLRNEVQQFREGLFKHDISTFDEDSVREAVLNAISHRDYRNAGSIWVRQYPRLLEIESPGGFPEGITADNVRDRQNPRNRRIAEALARCGLVERSGQGMDLMFRHSVRQGKPLPDPHASDNYRVLLRLPGDVGDARFLRFLEQVGDERLQHFTTDDFLVLDHVHRDETLPDALKPRIKGLLAAGIVERTGRGKVILSKKLYAFMGETGVHTRKQGLDRDTEKELLLKHLKSAGADGAPMSELIQVLPGKNRDHIKRLLEQLRDADRAHVTGSKRTARWRFGPASL